MRDEYFDIPVTIETDQVGQHLTVTRAAQAAELLVDRWPSTRGPKYRSALQSLMDVMEQRKAVSEARKAFSAAAKEAKVFVREGRKFG